VPAKIEDQMKKRGHEFACPSVSPYHCQYVCVCVSVCLYVGVRLSLSMYVSVDRGSDEKKGS